MRIIIGNTPALPSNKKATADIPVGTVFSAQLVGPNNLTSCATAGWPPVRFLKIIDRVVALHPTQLGQSWADSDYPLCVGYTEIYASLEIA